MKLATRYILVLFLGMFVGAAIILDMGVLAEREAGKEAPAPLPLDELRTFTEVFSRIKADYVEPVEDKKLLEDAVQGMLAGLDPHSAYLDSESFRDMRVETEGQFGGLGIEVTMENGFVKVVSPIEDTPAARGGVKPGDLVIRLDDKAVKGMTLTEAVRVMRGKPGTDITLTIVREGATKPLKITLTRAIIKIQSVKSRMLEPGFGYVRITQFQAGTDKGLADIIKKLEAENKGALRGMVLDLRNNPGGVLNAAVGVSDAFLDKGLIVYTEGRVADSKMKLSATPGDLLNGTPIVVLINGGSASASEIVAGALQDHKRAVIMGTKSFGKGSVQTIVPISNGAALKITTARYFTPNGRSIQALGIVPDIVTEEAKLTKSEAGDRLKEADLARHLENGDEMTKPKEEPKKEGKKDDKKKDETGKAPAVEDYQLQEALNLLKGISFFRAQSN
ncbi:MAG: peptidase S41 [Candidatus Muproteobacteria bacterium RIFCSPHIGHO2_12_FULL_60_33]|uniref:Peptidase S41 n=1 Tax=Candidatus Muproteobacteria bacterium RIFCSPLOWO2_01_FULL_60_18 TaxID=1817768 RepID=A0A1F6U384_9PROT|nr:MAG: peptidase S41 [Candidatus Muproteobacteria bacterium RIFCSPHIGHO2_01_60_12]OGI51853.1 MAG: peptidase S41 [Candidatus Muproteobacteria bacterium RIFCSPLOWO2_01_FULL_60_18]OGI54911.1 MAG: peptidase S41 [Candidatus Muproteobacteria bacterium RIFCSPHIGHO2_12_FULL_60_33]OGI57966.1 MAG: peptidase S41 [Candidatus Muproteobacteria bacterium RIFCSPHIGHO2_01_FULL_61_200]